jgi:hypothetical protein
MRFPKEDGRLAHWLDYSRDRMPPPMRRLIDSAFSLDPSGHRVRSAIQPLIQRQAIPGAPQPRRRVAFQSWQEPLIMRTVVYRVSAEGWSGERTADEAIVRIEQILGEDH